MDLSNSQNNNNNNNDFIDPQADHHLTAGGNPKKDDVTPQNPIGPDRHPKPRRPGRTRSNTYDIVLSYEFHPIRPIGSSSPKCNIDSSTIGPARAWNSADSKNNTESSIRNYGSLDTIEPAKVIVEKDVGSVYSSLLSEIDHTVKKYTDNLLHAMEGVSAHLSQLETKSRQIDNSVDKLKLSVGNNHGVTDGKLRQLENILRELMKSQAPKFEQQTEAHNTTHTDSSHPIASAPLHSHQQFPPVALIQPSSTLSPPNFPPPLPQQNLPYQVQLQNQFPQNPIPSHPQPEAYYPPAGQAPENLSQQYQLPAAQQHQTPPPAVLGHHREETPFVPSQTYPPPSIRQPPYPSSGAPPSQQLYATPLNMFEPASGSPGLGYSGVYGPSSMPGEPYPYSSSPHQYGSGSSMKPTQASLPAMGQSGLSGYQQIPTARILPQALPAASVVSSGPSSPGTGNRVPIDDVVDKVTLMGFPSDRVRATVRRLTESGQAVDLNTVLDKLCNTPYLNGFSRAFSASGASPARWDFGA
ncbi:putative zinc finger CCCH domain-containing protein 41-like [Capsicum annuum]|nr:putative zinc finger CCCH domain-containing protein 41-like [Capsicum annuum]